MIGANVIVDLSHHNGHVDLELAQGDGIIGIIQKATQGTSFIDPTLMRNRGAASDAGLLFGAYHFGVGGDGVEQADHFLNQLNPRGNDLLVLDLEANNQGPSMPLGEAHAFVTHIRAATGRWPGLYAGHYLKELLGSNQDPVLQNCWFWLAQYGPTPIVPIAWSTWTMWQYTDGAAGPLPHSVNGIGACDRDTYNGTLENLKTFWNLGGVATLAAAG